MVGSRNSQDQRKRILENIRREFDDFYTIEEISSQWRNLKDVFYRRQQDFQDRHSLDENVPQASWTYYEPLKFLLQHYDARKTEISQRKFLNRSGSLYADADSSFGEAYSQLGEDDNGHLVNFISDSKLRQELGRNNVLGTESNLDDDNFEANNCGSIEDGYDAATNEDDLLIEGANQLLVEGDEDNPNPVKMATKGSASATVMAFSSEQTRANTNSLSRHQKVLLNTFRTQNNKCHLEQDQSIEAKKFLVPSLPKFLQRCRSPVTLKAPSMANSSFSFKLPSRNSSRIDKNRSYIQLHPVKRTQPNYGRLGSAPPSPILNRGFTNPLSFDGERLHRPKFASNNKPPDTPTTGDNFKYFGSYVEFAVRDVFHHSPDIGRHLLREIYCTIAEHQLNLDTHT